MWLLVVMVTEFAATVRAIKRLQFFPVMEYTAPHTLHSVILILLDLGLASTSYHRHSGNQTAS